MKNIKESVNRPIFYVLIIITGVCLKFYNLEHKVFWYDEVCTIQHTSGIPDRDYPNLVPVNEVKNITFYKNLYRLNKQDYTIGSQIKGLFGSTQLTPLHYSFLIFWHRIVGDENIDYRLFSVFILILCLPFVFLLGKKLFKSSLAGWITTSLFSVSPIIHIFSQEARYYILWLFFVVLLNLLFLNIIKNDKRHYRITYIIVAVFSMYASVLSVFVLFGHFLYMFFTRNKLLWKFTLCLIAVFLLYTPWIYSLYLNREEIVSAYTWHSVPIDIPAVLPFTGQPLLYVNIFDFPIDYSIVFSGIQTEISTSLIIAYISQLLVFVLIITVFVYLIKKADKNIKLFLLLLIIPCFFIFPIYDIIRNGVISYWWRYQIFTVPVVILIVSFFLYKKMQQKKLYGIIIYMGLITAGILSSIIISKNRYWYQNGKMLQVYIDDARLFSSKQKTLLVTDFTYETGMTGCVVTLNECKSENIDIYRVSPNIDNLDKAIKSKHYSDVFVCYASDSLINNLKTQYPNKMDSLTIEGTSPIWRIDNNTN